MLKRTKPVLSTLFVAFALTLAAIAPVTAEEPAEETAAAEGKPNAEQLADWMVNELTGLLGLSESQVEQVRPLLVEDVERIETIFAGQSGRQDPEGSGGLEQQINASKAQTMAALEPILSPEQFAQLKIIQKERGEEAGGQLIVHRLQGLLDLTPEQRDQLAPIFAEDLRQRKQLMLRSGESGDEPRARRAVQVEMRELQKQLLEQLRPILSEEQMVAYHEYQNAMRQQMLQRMKDTNKGR